MIRSSQPQSYKGVHGYSSSIDLHVEGHLSFLSIQASSQLIGFHLASRNLRACVREFGEEKKEETRRDETRRDETIHMMSKGKKFMRTIHLISLVSSKTLLMF